MLSKYYHIRADVAVSGTLLLHQVDLAAPVLHCVLFGLGFWLAERTGTAAERWLRVRTYPLDWSANRDRSLEVGDRWGLFCVANPGSILSRLMVTGSSFVCAVRRRWTEQKETLKGKREFPLHGGISVLFVSPQPLEGYIPLLYRSCLPCQFFWQNKSNVLIDKV